MVFQNGIQTARICLTMLSIPIFGLVNDESEKVNVSLIKKTIENIKNLKEDKEAKIILETLNELTSRNPEVIYELISNIKKENIHRESNGVLILFSVFVYSLLKEDSDLFRNNLLKIETLLFDDEAYFKPFSFMINFFSFYSKECMDSKARQEFNDQFIYSNVRFLSKSLKGYFSKVYESNEEYDGDLEAKKNHDIYLLTIDLVIANMRRCSKSTLEYLQAKNIEELLIYITAFMVTEKNLEGSLMWMRRLNTFFKTIDLEYLTIWMYGSEIEKSGFQENLRLRRFFGTAPTLQEYSMQVVILQYIGKLRSLDFNITPVQTFTSNLSKMLTVFKEKSGKISEEKNNEANFLEIIDQILKICLNERDEKPIKDLIQVMHTLCKKYKSSFSKLLQQAEKNNQPRRMTLLKEIWEKSC